MSQSINLFSFKNSLNRVRCAIYPKERGQSHIIVLIKLSTTKLDQGMTVNQMYKHAAATK